MIAASERIDLSTLRDRLTALGIAESFFQSSILFALAKLRIFERIGDHDKPLDELAAEVGTQAGRNHSVSETRSWMEDAGFSNLQFCPMSLFNENSFLRGYRT